MTTIPAPRSGGQATRACVAPSDGKGTEEDASVVPIIGARGWNACMVRSSVDDSNRTRRQQYDWTQTAPWTLRLALFIRAKRVSNSHLRSPRNSALLEKKVRVFVCSCVCTFFPTCGPPVIALYSKKKVRVFVCLCICTL